MVTYLDLLNRAAGRFAQAPLNSSSIVSVTGAALIGVQAVNEAVADVLEGSVDLDFNQPFNDVSTVIGQTLITQPTSQTAWNTQIINSIKLVDTNSLIDLVQVPIERAKEIEFQLTTSGRPLFFYVSQEVIRVIPTPDQVYTLRVFYQGLVTQITTSNITAVATISQDFENALVSGIYAYLRRAQGDPEWVKLEKIFKDKLSVAVERNKFSLKAKGGQRIRMKSNVDRRV